MTNFLRWQAPRLFVSSCALFYTSTGEVLGWTGEFLPFVHTPELLGWMKERKCSMILRCRCSWYMINDHVNRSRASEKATDI